MLARKETARAVDGLGRLAGVNGGQQRSRAPVVVEAHGIALGNPQLLGVMRIETRNWLPLVFLHVVHIPPLRVVACAHMLAKHGVRILLANGRFQVCLTRRLPVQKQVLLALIDFLAQVILGNDLFRPKLGTAVLVEEFTT